ncbi:MAG: energy-coupling factor transporter ATPase [Anaerolineaceae bacterium]
MTSSQPLIEVENLNYDYKLQDGTTVAALQDVSTRILEGEYVAIVGANGSGKTTFARHLNALLLPTSGRVISASLDTNNKKNRPKIRKAVGMVFQNPEDQAVATVVEEDVAFGPENLGLPPAEIRERVEQALKETGLWDHRMRPPHQLSSGQMQRLALAGVLAVHPRCIIFDEATAMLDPAGRRMVLAMMKRLHQAGMTIITITHFMEEASVADRMLVFDRGRIVLDGSPAEIFNQPDRLLELGLDQPPVGQLANQLRVHFPGLPANLISFEDLVETILRLRLSKQSDSESSSGQTANPAGEKIIKVQNLEHSYLKDTPLEFQALRKVSLLVKDGSVHGLLGATGSGKSTLIQHLNALLLPQNGTVQVANFDLNSPEVDVKAVRRYVGLVFQNPENQLFEQYVGDEIAYGLRLAGEKEKIKEKVRQAMEKVGLDFEKFKDRLIFTLSGGERRKVALACTLALEPKILLLDEPTAGLDPSSRRSLMKYLLRLREQGITLLLSSHQMEDMALIADELTVMDHGDDVITGSTREVFSQGKRLFDLGLETPAATTTARMLAERGLPVSQGVLNADDLALEIKRAFTLYFGQNQGSQPV